MVPVQVSGLSGVKMIAAAGMHSLALTEDGSVYAWGDNPWGQLGDGTSNDRLAPTKIGSLAGVKSITAGAYHSMAIAADGSLLVWGDNTYGQLCDGSFTSRLSPTPAVGVVTSISGGWKHSALALADGSMRTCGRNFYGQLGTGTTTDSAAPVQPIGLSAGVKAVFAGGEHTLVLMAEHGACIWATPAARSATATRSRASFRWTSSAWPASLA
jgi:alpha-tubulin suppressor-like RCC1 family protein